MNIDGKIYRNLPQQVKKNKDDIEKLQEGFTQSGYTKAEADAKFADKIDTEASIDGIQKYITANRKAMGELQRRVETNTTDIAAQDSKIQTATDAATNASGVAQNAYTAATEAKEATDATTVQVNELTSSVDALDLYTSTLNTDLQNTKKRVNANEGDITALNTAIGDIDKVIPTDIAVINGKLGLEHDSIWLQHQKAINLGDNLTYDEVTNTLNAIGGGGSLDEYYTKEESDAKYAEKTSVYTKAESDEKYQPKGTYVIPSDLDSYEKKSDLNTTLEGYVTTVSFETTLEDYALKTEIPTDFYTRAQSDEKYQLKGDYVTTAGLTTTLDDYALKTEIPTDFYTKEESDGKYALKSDIPTDFYTKAESDEKYQPKGTYVVPSDLDSYEKKSDLNTTLEGYVTSESLGTTLNDYALKTEIPTDFYTKAQSDGKYQVKGDYVVNETLANYSTTEQMNTAINAAINTAITGAIEGAY